MAGRPRSSATSFKKGDGRPRGRRPKGSKNKVRKELTLFFKEFYESPSYRENLKQRIKQGEANHLETLGYHYTYGKPPEKVYLGGHVAGSVKFDFSGLTLEEKKALVTLLGRVLKQTDED